MNHARPARLLATACALAAFGIALPLMAQFTGGVVGGAPATKPATRAGMAGGVVGGTTKPAAASPATPPANWVAQPKTFPALPPDPIERADFRNKAVPIAKRVTSATAMMVIISSDGGEIGMTSDVIATVAADTQSGNPTFVLKQGKVGDHMQTSFDEAIRAVKVRYPKWEPGRIEFSFGEKYTPHDGGSAGTCFAAMLLSEIEGWDIDLKCAITGDITVDWKVRKIGGTSAKLRGATADKCLYAGVPLDNANDVADMYLLYGYESIRDIQVFSLETLQDATALLRKDRAPQVVEAMKEFTDLKPHIASKGNLSSPDVQRALDQILTLAPNHLSAKGLLDIGKGTGPKNVSATAALEIIQQTLEPYVELITTRSSDGITRQTVPATMTASARKQINALRPVVPKELVKVLADTTQIIDTTDGVASKQMNLNLLQTRWNTFVSDWDALGMDKSFREKLIRE